MPDSARVTKSAVVGFQIDLVKLAENCQGYRIYGPDILRIPAQVHSFGNRKRHSESLVFVAIKP